MKGKHRNERYVAQYEAGSKVILVSTYYLFRLSVKEKEHNLPSVKWKIELRSMMPIACSYYTYYYYIIDIVKIDTVESTFIFHLRSPVTNLNSNNSNSTQQAYKVCFTKDLVLRNLILVQVRFDLESDALQRIQHSLTETLRHEQIKPLYCL